MSTKKSIVDSTNGVQVNLGTGLSFRIGESIRPGWDEAHYCLNALWVKGYLNHPGLLPVAVTPEQVLGMSQEELKHVLPGILKRIDNCFDENIYTIDRDMVAAACTYVLSWFWYHKLGGPKPLTGTPIHPPRIRNRPPVPFGLLCPFCNCEFVPDDKLIKYSDMYRAYVIWLVNHAGTYHHFYLDLPWKSLQNHQEGTKKKYGTKPKVKSEGKVKKERTKVEYKKVPTQFLPEKKSPKPVHKDELESNI